MQVHFLVLYFFFVFQSLYLFSDLTVKASPGEVSRYDFVFLGGAIGSEDIFAFKCVTTEVIVLLRVGEVLCMHIFNKAFRVLKKGNPTKPVVVFLSFPF